MRPNQLSDHSNLAALEAAVVKIHRLEGEIGRVTGQLNSAYAERNAVVLAFAHLADALGWTVGQLADPGEPNWPVLMIDTPAGQVSWHFKADEMPPKMPAYLGEWDGHTTPEKYERLATLVRYVVASDERQQP